MVCLTILTEINMKVNSLEINLMVKVFIHGLMVITMMENLLMERSMVMEI